MNHDSNNTPLSFTTELKIPQFKAQLDDRIILGGYERYYLRLEKDRISIGLKTAWKNCTPKVYMLLACFLKDPSRPLTRKELACHLIPEKELGVKLKDGTYFRTPQRLICRVRLFLRKLAPELEGRVLWLPFDIQDKTYLLYQPVKHDEVLYLTKDNPLNFISSRMYAKFQPKTTPPYDPHGHDPLKET